jgi:hypothetical protein
MVFLIQEGCVVSCPFGDFLPIETSPDGTAKNEDPECIVTQALPESKWMVRLPNGIIKTCSTAQMKFVSDPRFQEAPTATQAQQPGETPTLITAPSSTATALSSESYVPVPVPLPATEAETVSPPTTDVLPRNNLTTLGITPPVLPIEVEGIIDDTDSLADDYDNTATEEDLVEGQVTSEDNDHEAVIYENETYDVHLQRQITAAAEKDVLIQQKWSVVKSDNKTNKSITWTVSTDHVPSENILEYESIGVRGVNWERFAELKSQLREKSGSEIDSKKALKCTLLLFLIC